MTCETLLEDYLQDAFEIVSAWDLPDDELPDAVNAQARLMAGIPLDHMPLAPCTNPYLTLQF
ncbi:MAG: hypothetical protein IPI75_05405 [Gammaproteobacteria bacterium]|jgi:hypothetical protein|nr:hypothetical protein [Gammaproteobacteria bacterium]MBK7519576.1 hypothetical protein [Gammaproteobacteria bacterium]MBK8318455.1 hypothetical protein [Betaproteobacteria bacterium]MBK9666438.1 hypothetical protein [Gammaproteobacteria bacterium]